MAERTADPSFRLKHLPNAKAYGMGISAAEGPDTGFWNMPCNCFAYRIIKRGIQKGNQLHLIRRRQQRKHGWAQNPGMPLEKQQAVKPLAEPAPIAEARSLVTEQMYTSVW